MSKPKLPLELPLGCFIAELLRHLNREQLEECLTNARRACYDRIPEVDSYSIGLARSLLACGDALEPSKELAAELAEARVKEARLENSYDAERFRKIAPLESALGDVVPKLRGLRNSLTSALETLGEPLDVLDEFVAKDRWR